MEVNEFAKLRAKIIILRDGNQQVVDEKVTDLADMPLDERGHLLTVKCIVRAQDYGVDIGKYYRDGILHKGFALKG